MKIVAAALALALSACATPYHGDGPLQTILMGTGGAGVSGADASPIGQNLWRISVHGNSFTGLETLHDFLLLKAAETAKVNGADGFEILEQGDATGFAGGAEYPGVIVIIRLTAPNGSDGYMSADDIISAIGPRVRRK